MRQDLSTENDLLDEPHKVSLIYGIYLLGLVTAIPFFVGVILAYIFKGQTNTIMASHYRHQISLFWRFVIGNVVLALWLAISFPLMFILIGFPMALVGGLAWIYLWIWMLFRSIKGIQYAQKEEGYPGALGWSI